MRAWPTGAAATRTDRAHHRRRGGVGSAAVQIAAAIGARPRGVASPPNRDYLESLGASEVFDYHAVGWAQRVRAAVPGGVDLLLDGAGGQTRGQALARSVTAAGRSSWSCKVLPPSSSAASPASRSPLTSTGHGWSNWAAWSMPASCGPRSGAVLPLEQVREALARVTGRHTRGKIVLQIAL